MAQGSNLPKVILLFYFRNVTTSNDAPPATKITAKSPVKPPPRPKSRVRDTIKLFDAKYNNTGRGGTISRSAPVKATGGRIAGGGGRTGVGVGGIGSNTAARLRARANNHMSLKTGGGEGMAGDGVEKFK